jgi:transcriptional regulator with XRE-family HTH domain
MIDLAQQIGHAIRSCRVEQKISQEKLALLCNIDRSYLGRIERGEVNITVLKLYEIAKILKISPQDLLPKNK